MFLGDEKYEGLYDLESPIITGTQCSAAEYRGEIMHRIELINGRGTVIIRNCAPRNYSNILDTSTSRSRL